MKALADVEDSTENDDLIREMADALELCLECDLSWEAEQAAEILIRRARQRLKD